MHELSIVEALMDRVRGEAQVHGATAVTRIEVRLGEQSGVDPQLLKRAYSAYRVGTIAERAGLEVTVVPVRWTCSRCGAPVAAGGPLSCDACGAPAYLMEGDEIVLDRIELEVA